MGLLAIGAGEEGVDEMRTIFVRRCISFSYFVELLQRGVEFDCGESHQALLVGVPCRSAARAIAPKGRSSVPSSRHIQHVASSSGGDGGGAGRVAMVADDF